MTAAAASPIATDCTRVNRSPSTRNPSPTAMSGKM